jgi:diaminohydroxyphosphoribosylaminopyrimidine deaminase/5-amino-6-(5-phosphoribosylamino)uracil reductase
MNDVNYMQMTLELAALGAGAVNPNPMVGAVIVKDDKIIAKGYHRQVGGDHAELDAIKNASESILGATLYCNLEPCCHTNKRTPPCAQRIIKEGISKVVIANLDPNPHVAGKGVELMREHGIEVVTGILETEGAKLNEIFFTHITQQRAHVQLKMAQTLDGNLATNSGDSKWITSKDSRELVHQERLKYDAILVGANTAKRDNPSLTVRLDKTYPKKRLILTSTGHLPHNLKIFNDEYKDYTYLIVPKGCKTIHQSIECPMLDDGNFDLNALNVLLYRDYAITSVYVEGGSLVHTSYIKQLAFDRISVFMAPKILGTGLGTVGHLHNELMQQAIEFKHPHWQQVGKDMLFTATKETPCSPDL